MESKITVDVDDVINGIEKLQDKEDLTEKLMLRFFSVSWAIHLFKRDGVTDKEILDEIEIDEDVIASYLESKGYTVTKD